MPSSVTNIVVAGLGGQGVLTASDVVAEAVVRAGYDVRKRAVEGMGQRGGWVTSDGRFGERVFSPMAAAGETAYLVVLDSTQIEPNGFWLRPDGVLITPAAVDSSQLPS